MLGYLTDAEDAVKADPVGLREPFCLCVRNEDIPFLLCAASRVSPSSVLLWTYLKTSQTGQRQRRNIISAVMQIHGGD